MHYYEIGEASELLVQEAVYAVTHEGEPPDVPHVALWLADALDVSDADAHERIDRALLADDVVACLSDDDEPVWVLALDPLVACDIGRRHHAYKAQEVHHG